MQIERHIWAVFLIATTAMVFYVRRRLRLRDVTGALKALIVANLPWLVLGAAVAENPAITIHNIYDFQFGWPAYAMIASIVALWAAAGYWVLAGGAERLAAARIALLNLPTSARGVKLFLLVALAGGIAGLLASILKNN
jgi:hypothetical protein